MWLLITQNVDSAFTPLFFFKHSIDDPHNIEKFENLCTELQISFYFWQDTDCSLSWTSPFIAEPETELCSELASGFIQAG